MSDNRTAVTTRLLEQHPDLRSTAQLVFFLLRDLFGHRKSFAYAGHRAMGRMPGLCRNSVRQALPALRGAGLIAYDGDARCGTVVRWVMPTQAPALSDAGKAVVSASYSRKDVSETPKVSGEKKTEQSKPKVAERRNRGKGDSEVDVKTMALTDDQKAALCTNTPDSMALMERYLRFGVPGLTADSEEGLKSTSMDWRRFTEGDEPHIEKWTAPMFAGYYWYLACWFKINCCTPPRTLTLPQFSRLIGDVRNLMQTRTKLQTHQYIRDMISNWGLILNLCGGMGNTLQLDSNTLSNPIVRNQVTAIQEHSKEWLEAQRAKFQDG